MFGKNLQYRIFLHLKRNCKSQRNLRLKIENHRRKAVVRTAFYDWRRAVVSRGQQAAIEWTLFNLVETVEVCPLLCFASLWCGISVCSSK